MPKVLRQLYGLRRGDRLTLTELAVLARHRDGPASATELADGEWITAQAVGAAIGALHRRGLVERTPDPDDPRTCLDAVGFLPAGRRWRWKGCMRCAMSFALQRALWGAP